MLKLLSLLKLLIVRIVIYVFILMLMVFSFDATYRYLDNNFSTDFSELIKKSTSSWQSEQYDILIKNISLDNDGTVRFMENMGDPLFKEAYSGRYWQVWQGDDLILRSPSLGTQRFSKSMEIGLLNHINLRHPSARGSYQKSVSNLLSVNQSLEVYEGTKKLESKDNLAVVLSIQVATDNRELKQLNEKHNKSMYFLLIGIYGLLAVLFAFLVFRRWSLPVGRLAA